MLTGSGDKIFLERKSVKIDYKTDTKIETEIEIAPASSDDIFLNADYNPEDYLADVYIHYRGDSVSYN